MNKVLKQVLGVDVDQRNLVVTLGRLTHSLSVELYAHEIFPNNQNGFKSLLKWTQSKTDQTINFQVVMEATGVYPAVRSWQLRTLLNYIKRFKS